jgi:hypothetical protein
VYVYFYFFYHFLFVPGTEALAKKKREVIDKHGVEAKTLQPETSNRMNAGCFQVFRMGPN